MGSPVHFRDVEVGEVLKYDVSGEGPRPVSIRIFVRAPYDHFVRAGTRFWSSSGLALDTAGGGFHLEGSIGSLLSGAIAFETPSGTDAKPGPESPADSKFVVYGSQEMADGALGTERIRCASYVATAVRGLAPGTPVEMLGIRIGAVTDVRLVHHATEGWRARVAFDVEPQRAAIPLTKRAIADERLHAVVESSSLVTGSKIVALAAVESRTGHDPPPRARTFAFAAQPTGVGTAAHVAAMSELLAQLADAISGMLEATS